VFVAIEPLLRGVYVQAGRREATADRQERCMRCRWSYQREPYARARSSSPTTVNPSGSLLPRAKPNVADTGMRRGRRRPEGICAGKQVMTRSAAKGPRPKSVEAPPLHSCTSGRRGRLDRLNCQGKKMPCAHQLQEAPSPDLGLPAQGIELTRALQPLP